MLFNDVASVEQRSLSAEQSLIDLVRDQVSKERAFLEARQQQHSGGTSSAHNRSTESYDHHHHHRDRYNDQYHQQQQNQQRERPSVLARAASEERARGMHSSSSPQHHHYHNVRTPPPPSGGRPSILHSTIAYSVGNRSVAPPGLARCSICGDLHQQAHVSPVVPHLDVHSRLGANNAPAAVPICHCCGYQRDRVHRDENLATRIDNIDFDMARGGGGGGGAQCSGGVSCGTTSGGSSGPAMVKYLNETLEAVDIVKEQKRLAQLKLSNMAMVGEQQQVVSDHGRHAKYVDPAGPDTFTSANATTAGSSSAGPHRNETPAQYLHREMLQRSEGVRHNNGGGGAGSSAGVTTATNAASDTGSGFSSHTNNNVQQPAAAYATARSPPLASGSGSQGGGGPPSGSRTASGNVTPILSSEHEEEHGTTQIKRQRQHESMIATTAASPAAAVDDGRSPHKTHQHRAVQSTAIQQHHQGVSATANVASSPPRDDHRRREASTSASVTNEFLRSTVSHEVGEVRQLVLDALASATANATLVQGNDGGSFGEEQQKQLRDALLQDLEGVVDSHGDETRRALAGHLEVVERRLQELHASHQQQHEQKNKFGSSGDAADREEDAVERQLLVLKSSLEHHGERTTAQIEKLSQTLVDTVKEVYALRAAVEKEQPTAVVDDEDDDNTSTAQEQQPTDVVDIDELDVLVSPLNDADEVPSSPPALARTASGSGGGAAADASILSIESPEGLAPLPTPSASPPQQQQQQQHDGDATADELREKDNIISEQRKMLVWLQEQQGRLQAAAAAAAAGAGGSSAAAQPHNVSIEDPREGALPVPSAPPSRSPTPELPEHYHQQHHQQQKQQHVSKPPLRPGGGGGGGSKLTYANLYKNPIRDLNPHRTSSRRRSPSQSSHATAASSALSYAQRYEMQRGGRPGRYTGGDVTRPTSSSFAHSTPRFQATFVQKNGGHHPHGEHCRHCADGVCEELDLH